MDGSPEDLVRVGTQPALHCFILFSSSVFLIPKTVKLTEEQLEAQVEVLSYFFECLKFSRKSKVPVSKFLNRFLVKVIGDTKESLLHKNSFETVFHCE